MIERVHPCGVRTSGSTAASPTYGPRTRVATLARTHVDFTERNPAVYGAMFRLDGGLASAHEDTPEPLQDAFAALLEGLGEVVGDGVHPHCSPRCSGRSCTGRPP